jgi:hypothetical protein
MKIKSEKEYTFAELHENFFPHKDVVCLDRNSENFDREEFLGILDKLSNGPKNNHSKGKNIES